MHIRYCLPLPILLNHISHCSFLKSNFTFQENLTVPCEFGEDSSTQTVFVQTCFAWKTAG